MSITRRSFHRLSALGGGGIAGLLAAAAHGASMSGNDRILVVIQLSGGNDGLNTVIPFNDDLYHKARPGLAIRGKDLHKISDTLALHPEMMEMAGMFKDGRLAVFTNVGYPNPNRSHFRSMDIWETASDADRIEKTGWLGRYLDSCPQAKGPLAIRIGDNPALSFAGNRENAATFASPGMLSTRGGPEGKAVASMARSEPTGNQALDRVQKAASDALALSADLDRAIAGNDPAVSYPPFSLCQSLRLVAQMISTGLSPRVYLVTLSGFDTHAAQAGKHAYLLQEFSQAVSLFHADLKARGLLDRVLGITFSEFGRRVAENKNAGTDHGAASVAFAFGGAVRAGIHGAPPDLANLDSQGDLPFKIDFRSIYAGILSGWFGADPAKVLGKPFDPVKVTHSSGSGA